jgi:hypothetical protein
MCAARNPDLQGLRPNDTGLTYASRLHTQVLRAVGNGSVRRFEFEICDNRRNYPRLPLQFPVRVRRLAGAPVKVNEPLMTQDISSTGVYFLAPVRVEPQTAIELEIGLTDRPRGRERVRMYTSARVVRVVPSSRPGWHGLAVSFDEITFERDDTSRAEPGGSAQPA